MQKKKHLMRVGGLLLLTLSLSLRAGATGQATPLLGPANNDFANAEDITAGPFPVTRNNVDLPTASTTSGTLSVAPPGDPPYSGTIFLDPDIITSSDQTTFQKVVSAGQGSRQMFDRRVNAFITVNAYLFNASFTDGLSAEIQVNPEFGSSVTAMVEAQKYGQVIGQLPRVLRTEVKTVWIHKGIQPFGGGNNNLLIHTGQAADYVANGILEETLVHEAAHTSLDATHAAAPGWLAAQIADGNFISTYARDNPTREDVAESFLPYLAVRYRSNRVSQSYLDTVSQTIPNRMTYFDKQSFNMYPITGLFSFSIYLPIIIKSEVTTTTPTSDFVNRVVAATNQNRIQNGCQPLTVNALLNQTADRHSKDMALNDVFDHTGSDGSTPEQRIAATGYTANATGENIAAGNPTPEEAVTDWMNSLGHRANILDCNFTEIGVGYYFLANDTGNNNYNHYWTQVFARP